MERCKRIKRFIIALIITFLVLFSSDIGWLESIATEPPVVGMTQEIKKTEYTNSEITHLIDEHIHNEKHRDIMKDRLVNGYTTELIAEKYDMSVRGVKYIISKCEDTILPLLSI